MMKMKFFVNLVNNEVVDNLPIYLVLKFHGCRTNGLRVIAFTNFLSDLLVLWTTIESS
jgi:hypothetical protein